MFYDETNRAVIRLGDTTDHGGKVLTGEERMMIMGRPAARVGDMVICPKCDNKAYPIIEGNEKMHTFGRQVAFDGHRTACGARLISSLSGNHGMGRQMQTTMQNSLSNPPSVMSGTLTADASGRSYSNSVADTQARPSDLLKLDERAILMRYREAINYMNKYGLRFQGIAPDSMIGYGLADAMWNGLRNNDYFPGMFTGGKYYRCRPQSEVVIDWLYDLDLNYEWIINFAVKQSAITGRESHTWVEVRSPIGSTVIHLDPLYDEVTYPSQPHPWEDISGTEVSNLFINTYRKENDTRFEWEYREDRFQSSQKLRERRIAD